MSLQTSYSETPAVALQGSLVRRLTTVPGKQAEASASVPFGTPMAFKPSGATSDIDATIPANTTDRIRGILYRTDAYHPAWTDKNGTFGELDSTGVRPGTLVDLLHEGEIWATCMTGCVPGDPLFVSAASGGGTYTAAGQCGNAAAGGTVVDCTKQGLWMSTASAGGLARLKVNFTAKA